MKLNEKNTKRAISSQGRNDSRGATQLNISNKSGINKVTDYLMFTYNRYSNHITLRYLVKVTVDSRLMLLIFTLTLVDPFTKLYILRFHLFQDLCLYTNCFVTSSTH